MQGAGMIIMGLGLEVFYTNCLINEKKKSIRELESKWNICYIQVVSTGEQGVLGL